MSPSGVHRPRFFQLGYATRDLDRAIARFAEDHGVTQFQRVDTTAQGSVAGPGLALAWRGDVMVELIEPLSASMPLYADALRNDPVAGLHHLGYLVDAVETLDELATDCEARGVAVPMRASHRLGLSAIYTDTRAELGHLTEFVYAHAEGRALFESLPRS